MSDTRKSTTPAVAAPGLLELAVAYHAARGSVAVRRLIPTGDGGFTLGEDTYGVSVPTDDHSWNPDASLWRAVVVRSLHRAHPLADGERFQIFLGGVWQDLPRLVDITRTPFACSTEGVSSN